MLEIDFAKIRSELEESNLIVNEDETLCYDLLLKITSLDELAEVSTKELISAFLYSPTLFKTIGNTSKYFNESIKRSMKVARVRTNRLL